MNLGLKIKGFQRLIHIILTIFMKFYCLYFNIASSWKNIIQKGIYVFY
jgi:hypothetical protein